MKIAPSVLAADFINLKSEMEKVKTADFIHLDIMDGHFVPNISYGPDVVKFLKKVSDVPFDVRLMISHPLKYLDTFKDTADVISFHIECEDDTDEVIDKIISMGKKPAVALKPGTPVEEVYKYCHKLYMVLVMTVEPGFGGQSFMAEQMEKVKKLKEKFPSLLVEADGGINAKTAPVCKAAGLDIAVAGTAVFRAEDPAAAIENLR
ncbi:MAG: ribulose-phosphate 3-epimerase [Clostridia bacterium]|nr:ribulose-phosphate 3-epimerase [Clostridia bacterium]